MKKSGQRKKKYHFVTVSQLIIHIELPKSGGKIFVSYILNCQNPGGKFSCHIHFKQANETKNRITNIDDSKLVVKRNIARYVEETGQIEMDRAYE